MSNNYFNSTGTIGFTCDVCGRELQSCTWMNGMRFCAKCYQETFGTNTKEIIYVYGGNLKEHTKVIEEKDKTIADLEAKLALTEKALELIAKSVWSDGTSCMKFLDTGIQVNSQVEYLEYFKSKAKEMKDE